MAASVCIDFHDQEYRALEILAKRECRTVGQQARYIVRRALWEANLLGEYVERWDQEPGASADKA